MDWRNSLLKLPSICVWTRQCIIGDLLFFSQAPAFWRFMMRMQEIIFHKEVLLTGVQGRQWAWGAFPRDSMATVNKWNYVRYAVLLGRLRGAIHHSHCLELLLNPPRDRQQWKNTCLLNITDWETCGASAYLIPQSCIVLFGYNHNFPLLYRKWLLLFNLMILEWRQLVWHILIISNGCLMNLQLFIMELLG